MLEKEQTVFSEKEIKSAGADIEDTNDKSGLLKAVQLYDVKNAEHKKVYNFVHFSVQEYLAAYHLSKCFTITQLIALNHKFWDGKYFGVWRMYTGITSGNNFPLKQFLSGEGYITAGMQYLFGFKCFKIAKELKANKVKCLLLYQIFLETPDNELKESLSTVVKNNTINLSEESLSLIDIHMLSFFITRSCITKEWQLINLSDCQLNDNKLQSFYQVLCIEDGRKKPIINILNISNNSIWELNTLIGIIAKFKIVHLIASKNSLAYKHITLHVQHFNKTLKVLDLSYNLLESEDVCRLCTTLVKFKNLEELNLDYNYIDENAEGSLVKAIVQWDNLRKFKCKHNAFSNPSYSNSLFEFTVKHLKYVNNSKEIKSIDFYEENEDIPHFISVLAHTNNVSGQNSKYISCISQLHTLSLEYVGTKHIPLTANAAIFFQKHFKVLETLNLSGLPINKESAHNFFAALGYLNKLQCLKMNNCKLTSKLTTAIARKIKLIKNVRELQLCNNCIDDEATKDLIIAFLHCNSFETFKFEGNQFKDESKALFQFFLSHLKFSGFSLNLSRNSDDITSFLTIIEYVKELPPINSVFIEKISQIKHLDMNRLTQQTSVQFTVNSLECFQIFNSLISLNISGTRIDENIGGCLVKAFGSNLQLEQLYMNKCQITSTTIKQICQQLKLLHAFNIFETNENFIGDEATEKLAIAILHWNLLECIEWVDNNLSPQAIFLLEMLIKHMGTEVVINFVNNHYVVNTFIKVLDYASNNIGERVTQFLSNLMKVTEICLQVETPLEMTLNASNTLQRFLTDITSFSISGIIITEQVANNLGHIFDNNKTSLKRLIINACELTSNTISKFVHQLKFTNKITEAEFCTNEIDDDATKDLVIAILHWNALHTLKLENNCFTENSKELFEILKEFSKSSSTCIKYNGKIDKIFSFISLLGYMTEVDVKNSVLVANVTKIEKLLLDCSRLNISEQFEINASRFFTRFDNLTDLNISGMIISERSSR